MGEAFGPRAHPERCDEFGGESEHPRSRLSRELDKPVTWRFVLVSIALCGVAALASAWAIVRVGLWAWSISVAF